MTWATESPTPALSTGSIRQRLIFQLALVAAALSLVFFFTLRMVAENAAEETQDNILAASATFIADAVYLENGLVRLELPYSALSMLRTANDDRVFYRVLANGETLTGYDDLPLLTNGPTNAPDGQQIAFSTVDYRGDAVRLASVVRPLTSDSEARRVVVVVGQTRFSLETVSTQITATATAIGVVFFLVATALSAFAARSALRPVEQLARSVGRRGPDDLRPVRARTPLELQPLVTSLNTFMERLRGALSRSEDFIAEAAHRVRTPLATVRTQAEVLHRQMRRDENRAAVRQMIRAIDESSRSAGQLLDHAMVTFRSEHLARDKVDLKLVLRDGIERVRPTAELKDMNIALSLPRGAVSTRGDAILLESALRNVLDNAVKYAPQETEIRVELLADENAKIHVRDQGSGFRTDEVTSLTERFSRGAHIGDVVGSGLGLTIADDVMQAHGGTLTLTQNHEGPGACVTLSLPLA